MDQAKVLVERGEVNSTKAIAEADGAQSEFAKAEYERKNCNEKFVRQDRKQILARFEGRATRVIGLGPEQLVKKGDPICPLTPD